MVFYCPSLRPKRALVYFFYLTQKVPKFRHSGLKTSHTIQTILLGVGLCYNPNMKSGSKTKSETRETKKKLKMKVSGRSVFKLKTILDKKSVPRELTERA